MKSKTLLSITMFCLSLSFSSCGLLFLGSQAVVGATSNKKANSIFAAEKIYAVNVDVDNKDQITLGSTVDYAIVISIRHENNSYKYRLEKNNKLLWGKVSTEDSTRVNYSVYDGKSRPVFWKDFNITIGGATVIDSGRVKVDSRIVTVPSGQLVISAKYNANETFQDKEEISLFDNKEIYLNFNGIEGKHPYSARNGSTGKSGGECAPGENGGHGDFGGDGTDGQNIEVYLKKMPVKELNKTLLLCFIVNTTTNDTTFIKINPENSKLVIAANGGAGADGADGGNAGDGGTATVGTDVVATCRGGIGGDGGEGGLGGQGGTIKIICDQGLSVTSIPVVFKNDGGTGGKGGAAGKGGTNGYMTFASSPSDRAAGGKPGRDGRPGRKGPKPEEISKPLKASLFKI